MISKRVACKPKNDSFKRLALYISASRSDEKCLHTWAAGCHAGQDLNLAMDEIKATQELNTRTKKEKTYHLIVSFRPGDIENLSSKDFQDIEKEFAEALGFEDHQRICAVHTSTGNPHIHIAYNMINKENFTRHDPYYDYQKRDKVCRQIEEKYNLTIDKGIEQQFTNYIEHKNSDLTQAFDQATGWQELHKELAGIGLEIKLRGNGCVIAALGHKVKSGYHVKVSDFSENLSKEKLVKRLGKYEQTKGNYETKEFFKPTPKRESQPAKTYETQTGVKSFATYVTEQKPYIDMAISKATGWQELHKELARIGLEIKLRGNGYVLQNIGLRARQIHNFKFSKTGFRIAKLEKNLGKFQSSKGNYITEKMYEHEPVKYLKSGEERERWKIYIKNKHPHPKNWRQFNHNFERFWSEEYER